MTVFQAFALPIARAFAKLWTLFYTAAAQNDEREDRRAEFCSDLYEHIADSRAEGYRPHEIAFHVLSRVVQGMKDDVAWSAPYIPSALAGRFQSGSESIGHMRTPGFLVAALAVLGMMNLAFFMSDGNESWIEWVFLNGSIPIVTFVMWNQERKWARRIINCITYVMTIAVVGIILWIVFKFRLYENTHFIAEMVEDSIPDLMQFAFAVVPVVLMVVVGSRSFRLRAFNDRWWPVFVSWGAIGAISLTFAIHAGFTTSLMTWEVMALLVGGIILLFGTFVAASAAVCFALMKGSAKCLGLMADGLRRLESSK